jgi:hypothetical protein
MMVSEGTRSRKVPTFEEDYDSMNTIAATMVIALILVIPLLTLAMAFPAFFVIRLPLINVNIGEYCSILFYLTLVQFGLYIHNHERQKYVMMRKAAEQLDEIDFQNFAELARGKR